MMSTLEKVRVEGIKQGKVEGKVEGKGGYRRRHTGIKKGAPVLCLGKATHLLT